MSDKCKSLTVTPNEVSLDFSGWLSRAARTFTGDIGFSHHRLKTC